MFNKGKQKAKQAAALAKHKASEVDESYSVVDSAKGSTTTTRRQSRKRQPLRRATPPAGQTRGATPESYRRPDKGQHGQGLSTSMLALMCQ